ncbi:leucine-rich repeat protein [Anaerosalibacter massiliensis]|uniref:Leucine-rich repeat protein n=1 Tax=Anaerosalibacter massiliensis TaxID=1347392 RepID=A0A9X2MH60_9FIRM|nr:leucine-rich repeat protein [Anaerosalibacter massiliensis]MCR2043940.1 leucine-rich repeat protein [Anaerosalibacter massiliensis]
MNNFKKKFTRGLTSLVLALILVMNMLPMTVSAVAYDYTKDYKDLEIRFWEDEQPEIGFYINAAAKYIMETVPEPTMGSTFGEWSVMDLLRGLYTGYGYTGELEEEYFTDYIKRIEKYVIEKDGILDRSKSTEWSRLMLTLTSLGYDVTKVAGKYDFIEKLSSSHSFSYRQGINGPVWEIIAMNTGGYKFYEQPDNKDANTFSKMINFILDKEIVQKDGTVGGWALFGKMPDPDMTGMTLQALAPYYLNETKYNKVREKDSPSYEEFAKVVERGIYTLSELQVDNGGYNAWGNVNAESTVQAIVALTALNIDPKSDNVELRYIGKNCSFITKGANRDGVATNNMIDALLTFWAAGSGKSPESGGFKHVTAGNDGGGGAGTGVNAMATDQALYGLIAYDRYKKGIEPLYDMTDMKNGEYKYMLSDEYRESKAHNATYVLDGETKTEKVAPYAAIELTEAAAVGDKKFKNWNTKPDGSGTIYKAGEYLSMPEHDITLYAQYRGKDELPTIKDIKPINYVLVDIGTTEKEAKKLLPKTTKIIDSDGEEYEVDLNWSIENYDGNKISAYNAVGTFELPEDVRQTDPPTELKVKTIVKVSKQIPESELEFNKDTNTIIDYKGKDKDVVIPNEIDGEPVMEIGTGAFQNKGLEAIYIPDSVIEIQKEAFKGNELAEVNIPNNIISIEESAFEGNKLVKISFPERLLEIKKNAFRNNELTNIKLPNSLDLIGSGAFTNNKLSKVDIPNNVIVLGDYAFSDNELIEVSIPNKIKEIRSFVFHNNKLKTINIPNSVEIIKADAFSKNKITELELPSNVKDLENGAFSSNEIEKINISEGVTTIGTNVFSENKLANIYIPKSVKEIGINAFADNNILEGNARIDNYKNEVKVEKSAFINNGKDGKTSIAPVFLEDEREKLSINEVEFLKSGELIAKGEINGTEITVQLPKDFPEDELDMIGLGSYTLKILGTEGVNIKQDGGAGGDWSEGKFNTVDVDHPTKFVIEKYGIDKEYILTIKSPEIETVTVVSIGKIDNLEVDFGTEKENVALPERIILNLSNGSKKEVDINWTSEEYDGNKAGEYKFVGSYELPEGVTGDKPEVNVKVRVKEELKPEVNKAKLEEVINKAEKIDLENKTEESIKVLKEAIAKGKEILNKEEVAQEEINGAVKAIETAIENLEDKEEPEPKPEVDKTRLEEIINKVENIELGGKTEDSIKVLNEAIAKGKEILNKEEVTQEELDNAVKNIEVAMENLKDEEKPEPKPEVDKTKLEEIINKAENIELEGKTEESIKILREAIAKGKEMFNKEEVTQKEIDNAVKDIELAIKNLEDKKDPEPKPEPKPEVDKIKLEEIINKAKNINTEGKTENSIKVLNEAIAKGKEILNKEEVTQEEVDNVVKAIEVAIESLKDKEASKPQPEPEELEKPTKPTKPEKPNKPNKPTKPGKVDKPDNKSTKPNIQDKSRETALPKTGESSMLWISILGVILLVVGTKLWIGKKKEREA